jgi:uncharacterized membrane protein
MTGNESTSGQNSTATPNHLQNHIDLIVKQEQDFLSRRTSSEKIGDLVGSFIGSLPFVLLHLAIFCIWIVANTHGLWSINLKRFDPPPFSLLGTCVAMEAIVLASFILMRQSRMGRRADERDHLILQLLLLSEKEVTAVLRLERELANKVGLKVTSQENEIAQLSQDTSITDVAETIKNSLPPD